MQDKTLRLPVAMVEIDNTGETEAGFRLVDNSTFPTTNLQEGDMHVDDGELFVYDGGRSKWLASKEHYAFASNGATDNEYLRIGQMASATTGFRIPYDGTIVAVTAQSRAGNATKGFEVQVNGVASISFNLAANVYSNTTANQNVSANDDLRVFCVSAGAAANDIVVSVFIKRRGS